MEGETFMVRLQQCPRFAALLAGLAAIAVLAVPAKAADFYAGKTITLLIGASAGGGYDTQGRLMARYLGKHIPGNPNIVPQNMPSGGGLAATNYIYNVAPKDGLTIALVQRGMLLIKYWNPTGVRFDVGKLNWLGSLNSEVGVTLAWHTAPFKTAKDLFEKQLTVGGITGVDPETTPKLYNALAGTKFKIVTGYPGTNEIALAMERGEVAGIGDWSWSSIKATHPEWLRDKKITLLMQGAMEREPELGNLPSVLDFVKNEKSRKILELYFTQKKGARPVIASPGLPADRLQILRKAFSALKTDQAFLADAKKTNLEIAPVTSEEMDQVIKIITQAPPEITKPLGEALGPTKK